MYWITRLEGGPRRVNHTAVAIGDYIYSFGGYCTGEEYTGFNPMDVHVLNTQNLRWFLMPNRKNQQCPDVPFQRYGHTAVCYEHNVYIWGGRNDVMGCNVLYCFDTKLEVWSKPEVTGDIPGVHDGHSACIKDHIMYIFGGFDEELGQFSSDVFTLNLKTMTWRFMSNITGEPPSYRDFHSATILMERMYIFGGRGDIHSPYHSQEEIYCPRIVYLDLKTMIWHTPNTIGEEPVGRRSHSAFIFNNLLYVFGGFNGVLDEHFNDLYAFDPKRNCWNLIRPNGKPPNRRRRHVCLVINNRVYLFGGTSPYNDIKHSQQLMDYDDTHVLDFRPTLKTLAILAVLRNNLDQSCLPQDIKWEIRTMTTPNLISRRLNNTG